MSRTLCDWNYKKSGKQVFFDKTTFEILHANYPVQYLEDFNGAWLVIPVGGGSAESGCDWCCQDTGNATETKLKAYPGGAVDLLFTSTSEKQEALIYHDDNRNFDLTKNLLYQAIVDIHTLPTLVAEMQWGLGDDYVEGGFDSLTYCAGFDIDGSGALNVFKDDNDSKQVVSTGITLTAGQFYVFHIVSVDPTTDIKFFVDGEEVCSTTVFPYIATGANAVLQPYFSVYKASGAGLGRMKIDDVKIFQDRS